MSLSKLAGDSATLEIVNCILGEILPSANIDRLEPTLFPPPPSRASRNADLLQPLCQADHRASFIQIAANLFHGSTVDAVKSRTQFWMASLNTLMHTWYVMPRKPRFNHPVRQVRTRIGCSQSSFAKLIGCSSIAIQRIENGTLKLSAKLAHAIMEATGADPAQLRRGPQAKALDMMGKEFSKESFDFLKKVLPCTDNDLRLLLHKLISYSELLLIASQRGGKSKSHAVYSAVVDSLEKVAGDFKLKESILHFLREKDSVRKRIYRVSDLRKFPDYARILEFKDTKRYKADKLIPFTIPRGWIARYLLKEKPVLPIGADMKLRDAEYILDEERPIPEEIKEAVAQALYWEIVEFHREF